MGTPSVAEERELRAPVGGIGRWISTVLVSFLAALQFLTIAPPLVRRRFTAVEMGRSVGFFPVVGVLLGGLLLGLDWLLTFVWPPGLAAVLVLAGWVLLTGAIHLDGFLDTCDGLFGGRSPEERLRILRDERVGAFAVIGGVLLVLLKYVTLVSLQSRTAALLLAPTLGRWGMTLAVVSFPYGRPEGWGRDLKDNTGWGEGVLGTGTAGVVAWFAAGWLGLLALALAGALTWLTARFALRRLPGLTGDLYGALCELLEVLVLLTFVAGYKG